jgi:pimeloyl-ACP methyl ester carboxylesterase
MTSKYTNGDNDIMVPTINSVELARKLPNAELSIFPDAGHGATAFSRLSRAFARLSQLQW